VYEAGLFQIYFLTQKETMMINSPITPDNEALVIT